MSQGKEIRLGRLFNPESKRMVLITLDHAVCINPMKELSDTVAITRYAVEGGANAILVNPGIAKIVYKEIVGSDTSLMLRIDGGGSSIGPDLVDWSVYCPVESALKLGADAVATLGSIGVEKEAKLAFKIGQTADICEQWGMPMLTEMLPKDILQHQFSNKAERKWPSTPELLAYLARAAAELGSDIVKGYYTGNPKTFREVIEYCPVPYVVLSGPASGDTEVFFKFVKDAIDCGARGVSVGRNVWTHKKPVAIVKALCRIVHENATVEQVLKEIR